MMKFLDFLTIPLGTWFRVPVYLHWTWTLFFVFITSVAGPSLGIVYAGAFFLVLLHEFGHCIAAQRYGVKPVDITLYPIGGAARMEVPDCPKQELVVSFAGPAVNLVLLGPLLFLSSVNPILQSLSNINIALIVFNLIPAFPMDGGRVLRALLSMFLGNHLKATVIAGRIGQCFCVLFAIAGIMLGNPMLCFIGSFIAFFAEGEIQAVKLHKSKKKLYKLLTGEEMPAVSHNDIRASSQMIADLQLRLSNISPE